jgi:hypothetical protein
LGTLENEDIDPLSVCFYNINDALEFVGFFNPTPLPCLIEFYP